MARPTNEVRQQRADDAERERLANLRMEIASNGRRTDPQDIAGVPDSFQAPATEPRYDLYDGAEPTGEPSNATSSIEGPRGDPEHNDPGLSTADGPLDAGNTSAPEGVASGYPSGLVFDPSTIEAELRDNPQPQKRTRRSKGSTLSPDVPKPAPGREPPKVLSEKDANELRVPLKEALAKYSSYFDQFLWALTKGHEQQDIWGSMDDTDLTILADTWIRIGRRNPKQGARVRNVVRYYDEVIGPGLITVPRIVATFQYIIVHGGLSIK